MLKESVVRQSARSGCLIKLQAISSGGRGGVVGAGVVGASVVGAGVVGSIVVGGIVLSDVPPMTLVRYITSTATPTTTIRDKQQLPTKIARNQGLSCHFFGCSVLILQTSA